MFIQESHAISKIRCAVQALQEIIKIFNVIKTALMKHVYYNAGGNKIVTFVEIKLKHELFVRKKRNGNCLSICWNYGMGVLKVAIFSF